VKRWLALLALGMVALGVQGGLATFIPRAYCPDLGLLVVLAIGLQWKGFSTGLLLATILGFAADLLSGSLLGAHALLRLLVFSSSALARRQLNLRGTPPLATFVAAMTLIYSFLLMALTRYFGVSHGMDWGGLLSVIPQAIVNALCAPAVVVLVESLMERLSRDDTFRGGLELDPRRKAP
jgi:rod shape-determining protein MreD